MRMIVSLCGENIIDWKADCADYLPDSRGILTAGYISYGLSSGNNQLTLGDEAICVLPKDKYRVYNGVCSCVKSWADTIAVTK